MINVLSCEDEDVQWWLCIFWAKDWSPASGRMANAAPLLDKAPRISIRVVILICANHISKKWMLSRTRLPLFLIPVLQSGKRTCAVRCTSSLSRIPLTSVMSEERDVYLVLTFWNVDFLLTFLLCWTIVNLSCALQLAFSNLTILLSRVKIVLTFC